MNQVEAELLRVATDLAAVSESRLAQTNAEIAELEEQLRQLQARRDGQLDVKGRLLSYRPKSGPVEYQCPNCWIVDGERSLLRTISLPAPSEDVMRCPTCGRDFGISP